MRVSNLVVVFSALFLLPIKSMADIVVSNQSEFHNAVKIINSGKAISMLLKPGEYVLDIPINASAPLSISGIDATISSNYFEYKYSDKVYETETHYACKLSKSIGEFPLFLDESRNIVPISESVDKEMSVNCADHIVGTREKRAGIQIQIPISENVGHLKNKKFDRAFGYFDCGWSRVSFKILKSDSRYFYCETLDYCNVKSFNYDKEAYFKDIRYVVYNAEVCDGSVYYDESYIYIPKRIKSLRFYDCQGINATPSIQAKADVHITGVHFMALNTIKIALDQKETCFLENCTFDKTLAQTLNIQKEANANIEPVIITACSFNGCSLVSGSVLSLMSNYIGKTQFSIQNCSFSRYDDKALYKNCSSMVSLNGDTEFENNVLTNTCRCHLFLNGGNIVVRGNILYNSQEFNSYIDRNLSSDWGMIYCAYMYSKTADAINNTKSKILIENCYIHDAYAYGKDARGIMIDDGRGDVVCRNNVIVNTQSYTIDSRNVPKFIGASSIRNIIENNLLSGKYRLVGGADLNNSTYPMRSSNVLLGNCKNVLGPNVNVLKEDVNVKFNDEYMVNNEHIEVSRKDYRKLKFHPESHCFQDYLKIR